MIVTNVLSGCNSAQLRLNSDDDTTEVSSEDISKDDDDVSSEDISKDDNVDKTGITDFDTSLVSGFVYVEEYDIFFSQVSDCYMKNVRCEAGVRNGDVLQIIFHVGFQTNNRRLTIEATGDSDDPYRFFSNRELWEENAVKVIDGTIYQNTGTITCAVVDSDKGPDIEIIVDNVVTCVAHPRFRDSEDINIEQYSDVVEVEFWDVDDDGVADMIVILSDGSDSVAVLCKGYVNQWSEGYTKPKAEVTKWLSENVSDMTADNAISYILDHKDEFNDI